MRFFTSESVTEGHPDKLCDQIADKILDTILETDKYARVACEVVVTTGMVLIMGEITTNAHVDLSSVARDVIRRVGYTKTECGFDADNSSILIATDKQSEEIAKGVDVCLEKRIYGSSSNDSKTLTGAGDQGSMFGFATRQTKTYMPATIFYANKLAKKLDDTRKSGKMPFLRPDGKTQITVLYDDKNNIIAIDTIVVSAQHEKGIDIRFLNEQIKENIILPTIPSNLINENTKYFINPAGPFTEGGPKSDSGLTGRKIMVDTYGGYSRHGGGAFSGKDPTKVDRTGAYFARFIAKNLVANNLCDVCEVQISYAIGVSRPVSVNIETFGSAKINENKIIKLVEEKFDMRPDAIIERFDLRRPIYSKTSVYGHLGREDEEFIWEEIISI